MFPTVQTEIQMSSLDFLNNYINPARLAVGQSAVRNSDFKNRLMDELDVTEAVAKLSQPPQGGTPQQYWELNYDQMMLVGMRESKAVRKAVLEKLKELSAPRPVTTADLFIQVGHQMKTLEEQQRLLATKADKEDVDRQIQEIKDSIPVLPEYQPIIAPVTHKLISDIARQDVPWMTKDKVQGTLDKVNWPYTICDGVSESGYPTSSRAYLRVKGQTLQLSIEDYFARIRRQARQVTNMYWEHDLVPGRFQIKM